MFMPIGMGAPTGNVCQYYKARFGCGYADYGQMPKSAPYPMDMVDIGQCESHKKHWLVRFLEKIC